MNLQYINLASPLNALESGILKKLGFRVVNEKLFLDKNLLIDEKKTKEAENSRNKAVMFERRIAAEFSKWWSGGLEGTDFRRYGGGRQLDWRWPADILPPHECPFVISCHNEESWSEMEKLLTMKEHPFSKYWDDMKANMLKLKEDKNLYKRDCLVRFNEAIPLVVISRNNMPVYVMFNEKNFVWWVGTSFQHKMMNKKVMMLKMKNDEKTEMVTFALLDDLLSCITPEMVKDYVRSCRD